MSMAYQQEDELLFNINHNNYYYKMIMQKKHQFQPTKILNSLFKSTVNKASQMLLSVVSNHHYAFNFSSPSFASNNYGILFQTKDKWKLQDHFKFLSFLFTWFTMWASRLVTDFFPSFRSFIPRFLSPHNHHQLTVSHHHQNRNNNQMRQKCVVVDDGDGEGSSSAVGSSSSSSSSSYTINTNTSLDLVPAAAAAASTATSSSILYSSAVENQELISHDGFLIDGYDRHRHAGQSVEALSRALSHILALLNELPVTSRKYEFAIATADKLLDENTREGNTDLLHVNRAALSSAFESTVNRLSQALDNVALAHADQAHNQSGPWSMRLIRKLPLGTYIAAYMKGGLSALFPALESSMWQLQKRRCLMIDDGDEFAGSDDQSAEVVGAEKLAQELVWIIHKLRACHGVDEALVQWSLASNLSSLALNANPRVQALLIKISASLLGDISRAEFKVHTQVQYRMLVLWLPLFCYASNGLRYPVLSSFEKMDVERTMERMIASLSVMEQEIVLRNWLQDFAICSSDWPNLRPSYDRWCQSSRQLVI